MTDVSVIIAAFKAQDYVHKAIASALSQEGVDLEVIVVDDASPDDTAEAARMAGRSDPRLKVIRQEINGGPSIARNTAIASAKGRYVAVLDADDSFAPQRLSQLVRVADETQADIIVDNIQRVDGQGQAIEDHYFLSAPAFAQRHDIDLATYIRNNRMFSKLPALGYLKPLFKTETLKKHGVEYDPSLRNSEDYYLVADLLACGARMVFEPIAGYLYQVEAGSISHRLTPELTSKLVNAAKRFELRHRAELNSDAFLAAKAHTRRLKHAHTFVSIVDHLKAKQFLAVLGALIQQPDAFGFVVSQLAGILIEKVTKKQTVAA